MQVTIHKDNHTLLFYLIHRKVCFYSNGDEQNYNKAKHCIMTKLQDKKTQ